MSLSRRAAAGTPVLCPLSADWCRASSRPPPRLSNASSPPGQVTAGRLLGAGVRVLYRESGLNTLCTRAPRAMSPHQPPGPPRPLSRLVRCGWRRHRARCANGHTPVARSDMDSRFMVLSG
eukprot:4755194-Pleurochrysis_carterae.AAC.2